MFDKTVNFDNDNSWEDFGIVFKDLTIGAPQPQLVLIDVPFRNGSLDETDYFGDVKYNNRDISMSFLIPWWAEDQHNIYSKVLNKLNGQRKRIKFSADQDWYYEGRLSVGDFSINDGFWTFDISVTADPYKYKDIVVNFDFEESYTVNLYNDVMSSVPIFTTDNLINVTYEGVIYQFGSGSTFNPLLKLKKGENILELSTKTDAFGNISYKQGRL